METLIAFSVYYRADDPRISGKMDQFYTKALALYKDYLYPESHKYIGRKMENRYRLFPFPSTDNVAEDDSVSGEEGGVVMCQLSTPVLCPASQCLMARRQVLATKTFFMTVRLQLITLQPSMLQKRAWISNAWPMVLQAAPPSLRPALVRWRRLLLRGLRPKKVCCAWQ